MHRWCVNIYIYLPGTEQLTRFSIADRFVLLSAEFLREDCHSGELWPP